MASKLDLWQDKEKAKCELLKRFTAAKEYRSAFEPMWQLCLSAAFRNRANDQLGSLFPSSGVFPPVTYKNGTFVRSENTETTGLEEQYSQVYCNYINKDLRFLHSQLSTNPPSVIAQPTSADPSSRKAATAANNVSKYMVRQYRLNEIKDQAALWALTTGTGYVETRWDPNLGDPLEFDPDTQELVMEGDIAVSAISTWDIWLDPIATTWKDVRFYFRRWRMAKEEAERTFGEYIEPYISKASKDDVIDVYQYWEKGLPVNGYQGRFCWLMEDGTVLGDRVISNPHGAINKLKNGGQFRKASLPLHIFTDNDLPGSVYGLPTILFTAELQHELNVMTQIIYASVRANSASHMLIHEDTELHEDSITNDPLDILRFGGTGPAPTLMVGNPISPVLFQLYQAARQEIPDLNGINEAQYGKMSRETSGSAMNFATQNGNSLRARVFSKYVQFIEDIYRDLLTIVQEKWTTERTLIVEGKEKSFATMQFKSSDIESGYEFTSQYGTDFSLDPVQRRKEILDMWPLLEKMEIPPRILGSMLKLNDLDSMLSTVELAADRQQEVFDRMINDPEGKYIPPNEMEDHDNRLTWAHYYLETAEFNRLDNDLVKANIIRHVKEREQMAAASKTPPPMPGQPAGGGAGGQDLAAAAAPPPNLAALLGS